MRSCFLSTCFNMDFKCKFFLRRTCRNGTAALMWALSQRVQAAGENGYFYSVWKWLLFFFSLSICLTSLGWEPAIHPVLGAQDLKGKFCTVAFYSHVCMCAQKCKEVTFFAVNFQNKVSLVDSSEMCSVMFTKRFSLCCRSSTLMKQSIHSCFFFLPLTATRG